MGRGGGGEREGARKLTYTVFHPVSSSSVQTAGSLKTAGAAVGVSRGSPIDPAALPQHTPRGQCTITVLGNGVGQHTALWIQTDWW